MSDVEEIKSDHQPTPNGMVRASYAQYLERKLNASNERINRLEDIIKRAATRFFADGSDGRTASDMLTILDEAREAKP